MRTFCKEKNVVLMPIRICDERSKSVNPTKPSGIFIAQASCIFQCSGSARPRVSEIVREQPQDLRLRSSRVPPRDQIARFRETNSRVFR